MQLSDDKLFYKPRIDICMSEDLQNQKHFEKHIDCNWKNPEIVFDQSYYKRIIAKKDEKIQSLNKKIKEISNQAILFKSLLQNKETQSNFFKAKIKQELQKNRLMEDQLAYINLKIRKLAHHLKSSRKNQDAAKKLQDMRKSELKSLGKQLINESRTLFQGLSYQVQKVVQVYKKAHNLKQKMKENKMLNAMQNNNGELGAGIMKHSQHLYQTLKVNQNS